MLQTAQRFDVREMRRRERIKHEEEGRKEGWGEFFTPPPPRWRQVGTIDL